MKSEITQKELRELLHYDQETGIFRWKVDKTPGVFCGVIAGSVRRDGYCYIKINYKTYLAHRLAFLYVDGYFPEHQVDHMNGDKLDNSWGNLRHVTGSCNMQNKKTDYRNSSGYTGVSFIKKDGKWQSQLRSGSKKYYLGFYETPLEAALARYTAEVQCPEWTCNHRSELVKAIKKAWPQFDPKATIGVDGGVI